MARYTYKLIEKKRVSEENSLHATDEYLFQFSLPNNPDTKYEMIIRYSDYADCIDRHPNEYLKDAEGELKRIIRELEMYKFKQVRK